MFCGDIGGDSGADIYQCKKNVCEVIIYPVCLSVDCMTINSKIFTNHFISLQTVKEKNLYILYILRCWSGPKDIHVQNNTMFNFKSLLNGNNWYQQLIYFPKQSGNKILPSLALKCQTAFLRLRRLRLWSFVIDKIVAFVKRWRTKHEQTLEHNNSRWFTSLFIPSST